MTDEPQRVRVIKTNETPDILVPDPESVPNHEWVDDDISGEYDWEELQPKILQQLGDSHSFVFTVHRERDDNLSFSSDAIESLARGFMTFFLARCSHEYKTKGLFAQHARVTITIDLE